jgi:acylphosphatase
MPEAGGSEGRRWVVEGLVQGVGFRWFIHDRAMGLGVRGWVRNLEDGAVEVVGLASPDTMAEFDEIVRRGPPGAHVIQITTNDVPHEIVDTKSFIIKH